MFNSPVAQCVCTFIVASLVTFPVALVVSCKLLLLTHLCCLVLLSFFELV